MADVAAAKLRRLEHHRGVGDVLKPSSFNMEHLPSEIQPVVMSLLSLKEAARTSIVARNWRKLWTCHPNLCFYGSEHWPTEEDYIKIKRTNFIETVNYIVQQHTGTGLNKFSIRFRLGKEHSDHLYKWIGFATASRARIIDIDLWPKRSKIGPLAEVCDFPLELLGVQDGPFIQSLFLKYVSIKAHSDLCGFRKIRRLLLHCVEIFGDLPGLLSNCCALEDLELVSCRGVVHLNVPHQLNELRHLLISKFFARSIDFHVAGLAHFEYSGEVIPIALHGCSKLEKATITFIGILEKENFALSHAFTSIPTISAVKVLNLIADMQAHPVWAPQVHALMTRPAYMFMLLRHLTCEIKIFTDDADNHVGMIRFAHFLNLAPQLETLQLHMFFYSYHSPSWHEEPTGNEVSSCLHHLNKLKTVYMSGFRCYWSQVELLYGILVKSSSVLEHITIDPKVKIKPCGSENSYLPIYKIRDLARRAYQSFGKAINVVE